VVLRIPPFASKRLTARSIAVFAFASADMVRFLGYYLYSPIILPILPVSDKKDEWGYTAAYPRAVRCGACGVAGLVCT